MMQEKVVKFFDDQALDYNSKYRRVDDLRSFIFSERKKVVLDMLGTGLDRVLDIGCGPGAYADELVKRCRKLYGVDLSHEMIAIAKSRNYNNSYFSIADIRNLEFQDGFFDGIVCVGVLEYLDSIETAIKEVARVTKEGGVAIFTAPNALSILNWLDYYMRVILKACRKALKMNFSNSFIDYKFEPKLLCKHNLDFLLQRYGFRIEKARFHIFRISFLNRLSPKFSLLLAKRLNFISNRFLVINFVIKARKKNANR